jgi:hypothetical protein
MKNMFSKFAELLKSSFTHLWNLVSEPINLVTRFLMRKPSPQEQESAAASNAARDEERAIQARQRVSNALEAVRVVARAHSNEHEVSPENLRQALKILDPAITAHIRRMSPDEAHQLGMRSAKNLHGFLNEFTNGPAPSGNVVSFPNHVSGARASAYVSGAKVDAQATEAAKPRLWAHDANGASGMSDAQREAALVAYGRFVERGDAIRAGIHDFEDFVTHVQAKAAARNPRAPSSDAADIARKFA